MDEKEYSVSEAVRLIGVESHVLRYWEEELNVEIRRTSQGHRVYSQENVDLFCQVKKLKEKGIQLKAIRVLLFEKETDSENAEDKLLQKMLDANGMKQTDSEKYHVKTKLATLESDDTESDRDDPEKKDTESDRDDPEKKDMESDLDDPEKKDTESDGKITNEVECGHTYEILTLDKEPDKLRQFERILKRMMEEVVSEQNEKLEHAIEEVIREEIEDLYLQYYHMTQEAAVTSQESGKRSGKIAEFLRRFRR